MKTRKVTFLILGYICVVCAQKPAFVDYNDEKTSRNNFAKWLLLNNGVYRESEAEFPPYDGWYNNLARPDSGAIDKPLLRRWPAAYEDGTYLPAGRNRPNPFDLSDQLLTGPIGSRSRTGKNALLVFFGQQVVEEILDAQRPACPPEYFNIDIPPNHKYRNLTKHTKMPLLRTRFDHRTGLNPNNPRQQLNEITPYLDGGLMYGITKQWADQLRTYSNGTIDPDGLLAYCENGLFPEWNTQRLPLANPPPPFNHSDFISRHEIAKVDRFFKLGNPRGNENTFLLTFGILWFRWHNFLARNIRDANPKWSSEQVFNEARKWVIATQQHIIIDEWLPSWLRPERIPAYHGYDPSIDPQIDQFFQSAAFRFGHTLVTPGVYMRDYGRNNCTYEFKNILGTNAVRTCNAFWRPQDAILKIYDSVTGEYMDIDRLLMGMAYQLCEAEDHKIVEDLRGNVFGPLEFPRRDLMAINIQRGRDHGLPDFNSARKAYGLTPITTFNHFPVEPSIIASLAKLYDNDINNIDVWVGGILETGDGPGELFETIIIDQFRRIRDGDRFWYENKANNLFNEAEITKIKQITLYDIIMTVTKMDPLDIQRNVTRVPLNDTEIHPNCRFLLKPPGNCTVMGLPMFTCYYLPLLNEAKLNESCKQGTTYDYFSNSELSFILTFTAISAIIIGLLGLVYGLIFINKNTMESKTAQRMHNNNTDGGGALLIAKEWVGPNESNRLILLRFNTTRHLIEITTSKGILLRSIDCTRDLTYKVISDAPYLIIHPLNEYDLVLLFETDHIRSQAIRDIVAFVEAGNCRCQEAIGGFNVPFKTAKMSIVTKESRQKQLEMFFRVVISQAFNIPHNKAEILNVDNNALHVLKMELTLEEFADVLNMTPDAVFVTLMFKLVDKDQNGFISFRELVDLMAIFVEGSAVDKAKLLFNMYDIDNVQQLSKETFKEMLRSFLDHLQGKLDDNSLTDIINNLVPDKEYITLDDFIKIMDGYKGVLCDVKLGFKYPTNFDNARKTVEDIYGTPEEIMQVFKANAKVKNVNFDSDAVPHKKLAIIRIIEKNCKEIFWLTLYTLILIAIFAERSYYYSVEREHSGLRTIAGYGVTVTRGAASAMMFTYSSLLVTMCRNLNTKLRDTVANKYFPFDSSVEIHKYIAYWALFFTVMHIIGHAFNFYHIATQTADDLTCLFRNYFHATHELPKFHYWCWETMTGFTGVVLTVITAIIYVFSQPIVRRKLYNHFWYTHALYPLFFIFMILHGSGRLIQAPFFYYFFLGPVILFSIDQIISISRKKIEIVIQSAKILPSNVTMLEIQRPNNFEYKSGQWVRIACLDLNPHEYHPFTLSSSPDEATLTLHIRAVGPWTNNIRKVYDDALQNSRSLPKIYLDGPFGEGHQDWHQYEVSILIGGGIGVTPFASILKDIVCKGNFKELTSKKVYFVWISRTQKQFEWLVEMLKEIETRDKNEIINTHIYITEFYEKFDLRTIMLYIFERHYQKLSNKSLFTNLQAITHFGRPNFNKLFKTIQDLHYEVQKIGVFSCGSPTMISGVDSACIRMNKATQNGPILDHHFKTF